MPKIIETTVYTIDELAEHAREHARNWARDFVLATEWHKSTACDFAAVAEALGIELQMVEGSDPPLPELDFAPSYPVRETGTAFSGTWWHDSRIVERVRSYAPRDERLAKIGDTLQGLNPSPGTPLRISIHRHARGSTADAMEIGFEDPLDLEPAAEDALLDRARAAFLDLSGWLLAQLESEYEHLNQDDTLDDLIRTNEWTFTEDGARFG